MEDVRIDVGVFTPLEVDLSEFDFEGVDKVIFTVKNKLSKEVILTREFSPPEETAETDIRQIMVTPEESLKMRSDAEYDIILIDTTAGECYKNDDNGKIFLRKGCGQCRSIE